MALIEVENLSKTYSEGETTKTTALKEASFKIDNGDFVAIIGPSGSGKSTLLHILGFLDRQTGGSYYFDGKSIDDYSDQMLARIRNKKMGFVFQAFNLLPRTTVLDNVKLPLLYSGIKESLWQDMSRKAADSVGLLHRINHDSSQLSGGEKQRVAIARALVNDPQVIFADEPTGNLDSKSGQAVIEILKRLNEKDGKTIILVTHENYIAESSKRILSMRDGSLEGDQILPSRQKTQEKTGGYYDLKK